MLLCITIMSMPTIYSKFSSQHDINDVGECIKCHSDIQHDLESSIYHESLTCEYCHGSEGGGNDSTHGNVINPRCLYCHSNIEEELKNDSHSSFISGAIYSPLRKEENEACISCHTTKSLGMTFTYSDTYKLTAARDGTNDSGWQITGSKDMESIVQYNISYDQSSGQHYFPSLDSLKCEKCHQDMRDQLSSSSHTNLLCTDCHGNTGVHASRMSLCTDCHKYTGDDDAHIPFIFDSGKEKNMACSSCHSSFNNNIEFKRPQYIEWDVVSNVAVVSNIAVETWIVANIAIGADKSVFVNKSLDGKLHNVNGNLNGNGDRNGNGGKNVNVNCILCHQDIRDAVIAGGHSNERWRQKHSYSGEVTSEYCKSCHMSDSVDLSRHSAIKISCVDCHGKSKDMGNKEEHMGNIEESIKKQKLYLQSYLCMSCKNTGNPVPDANTSLHFKYFTEPEVTIYVNGEQRYP